MLLASQKRFDRISGSDLAILGAILKLIWLSVASSALLLAAGCATTYEPQPLEEVPFQERAETQEKNNIRVTAAVPSAEESEAIFGVPLYEKGIQPVWLMIENKRQEPVRFMRRGTDPENFAPLEAAYINHFSFSDRANEQMDRYFHEQAMVAPIGPGRTNSGFVFTNLDLGTKDFNVDIVHESEVLSTFTFFIPVPGLKIDYEQVDFEALYPEERYVDHQDLKSFRRALERWPCCTLGGDQKTPGDPLNLVFIGKREDLYRILIRAGWDETETIHKGSAWKTARSAVFGGEYRYSPISPLYVFGRAQDAGFQKTRKSIHRRNHLRIWLAPMRFRGKAVWAGQISRDIGVRFTKKTITTHKIDPDVDEARGSLLQSLTYARRIAKFAYVKGVGPASIDSPRHNYTGDPYFTDGYRLVLMLSSRPVSLEKVKFVPWEVSVTD